MSPGGAKVIFFCGSCRSFRAGLFFGHGPAPRAMLVRVVQPPPAVCPAGCEHGHDDIFYLPVYSMLMPYIAVAVKKIINTHLTNPVRERMILTY